MRISIFCKKTPLSEVVMAKAYGKNDSYKELFTYSFTNSSILINNTKTPSSFQSLRRNFSNLNISEISINTAVYRFARKFPPVIFHSSIYLLRKDKLKSLHLYGSLPNYEFSLLMKSFENSISLQDVKLGSAILNPTNVWSLRCLMENIYIDRLRVNSSLQKRSQKDTWYFLFYFLVNEKLKMPCKLYCPDPPSEKRNELKFMMKHVISVYCKLKDIMGIPGRDLDFNSSHLVRRDFAFTNNEHSILL